MSQAVGSNTAGYSDNLSSVNSNPSYHSIESITPYVPFSLTGGKKSKKGKKGKKKKSQTKGCKNRCPSRCHCESCVCEVICRPRKKTTRKKKKAKMMGTIIQNLPTRTEFGYILANLGLTFGTPTLKLMTSAMLGLYENREDILRKVAYVFDRLTKGETTAIMRLKESEFRAILKATNQNLKEKHLSMLSETMIDTLVREFKARLVHERRAHTAVPNTDSEFENFMDVVPVPGGVNMSQEGDKLKERYEKESKEAHAEEDLLMGVDIQPGIPDSPWNLVNMAGTDPKKGSAVSLTEESSGENGDSGESDFRSPVGELLGPNERTAVNQRFGIGDVSSTPLPDIPGMSPSGEKPPTGAVSRTARPRAGAGYRKPTKRKRKSKSKNKKVRSRRYR
jgi:hypothetical protein